MRKKIISCFIFIISMCIFPNIIYGEEDITCDYENGLIISYKDDVVDYNYSNFINQWWSQSILFDSSVSKYTMDEIILEQEEFKKTLGKNVCPGLVYVCEKTQLGIEAPSLLNISETIGKTGGAFIDFLSGGLTNISENYDNMWSVFQINKKNLYIMGQGTHDEDYSSVKSGLTALGGDGAQDALDSDFCELGDDTVFEGIVDFACGSVGGLYEIITSLAISDDKTLLGYQDFSCKTYKYPENGKYKPINIECPLVHQNLILLDGNINDFNNCAEDDYNCRLKIKQLINSETEIIRTQCNFVLSSFTYTESQKDCIDMCLSLKDKLKKVDGKTNTECGISENLVIWIGNIVRWIKYIIPVAVIVLGIIDFIKAMAGDKDDEMKKAQGRFVKRLIAAALIFLVPILVEFVLDKMGLLVNDCGIIDL